jgi:hypothetical protein
MKAKEMAWVERVHDPRGDGDGGEGGIGLMAAGCRVIDKIRLEERHPPGIEKDQSDFGGRVPGQRMPEEEARRRWHWRFDSVGD